MVWVPLIGRGEFGQMWNHLDTYALQSSSIHCCLLEVSLGQCRIRFHWFVKDFPKVCIIDVVYLLIDLSILCVYRRSRANTNVKSHQVMCQTMTPNCGQNHDLICIKMVQASPIALPACLLRMFQFSIVDPRCRGWVFWTWASGFSWNVSP